jgi:hypothetical protein
MRRQRNETHLLEIFPINRRCRNERVRLHLIRRDELIARVKAPARERAGDGPLLDAVVRALKVEARVAARGGRLNCGNVADEGDGDEVGRGRRDRTGESFASTQQENLGNVSGV